MKSYKERANTSGANKSVAHHHNIFLTCLQKIKTFSW